MDQTNLTDIQSAPDTARELTFLQPLIYPEIGISTERDVYVRLGGAAGISFEREAVEFGNGGSVRFDTYFNLFSLGKWQKFCGLQDFRLVLEGEGRFELTVFQAPPDVSFERIFNDVVSLDPDTPLEIDLSEVPSFAQGGIVYFALNALGAGALTRGGWATRQAPLRTPDLQLSITTFKREEAVRQSVTRFRSFISTSPLKDHIRLLVVDNGRSAEIDSDAYVTAVENENLGGAGGFTRGLIEARRRGASHCLFMDDDATIHMKTLERVWLYLAYCEDSSTAMVGALAKGSDKWAMWENGATFHKTCHRQFGDLDLRDLGQILELELETTSFPNNFYGGWWFFAFPLEHVNHLPFPFFVRGDDVSFSITHDFRMATLNGVITFQNEDFTDKITPMTEYLDLRSHMVHHLSIPEMDIGAMNTFRIAMWFFTRKMCFCQYETLEALNMALEDVMAGPDFFAENADMAQRRADIKALMVDEVYKPIDKTADIPEITPHHENAGRLRSKVMLATLNGHLIPFFGTFGKDKVANSMDQGRLDRVWGGRSVTYVDKHNQTVCVTRHSKAKAYRQALRFMKNGWAFLTGYDKLKSEWQDGYRHMTTDTFWNEKLDLD